MKLRQAVLPFAAAMLIAGCGNRGTAQNVVGQANRLINAVKEEGAFTAPAELKAAETTLEHMKKSFDAHEYDLVAADVPQFNAQVDALKAAMASKQGAVTAAAEEWSALSEEVPKSVEAIQARVDSFEINGLPKNVTTEELETAKTELETLKTTWAEATVAASTGNTLEATDKGRQVHAKVEELKNQLGMNETLASVN